MANVQTELEIDWTACELIERVPGKVSGRRVAHPSFASSTPTTEEGAPSIPRSLRNGWESTNPTLRPSGICLGTRFCNIEVPSIGIRPPQPTIKQHHLAPLNIVPKPESSRLQIEQFQQVVRSHPMVSGNPLENA
jgi:hypothetical protein